MCQVRHTAAAGNEENFFVVPSLLPDADDIETHFSRLQSVLESSRASKEQFFFDFSKSLSEPVITFVVFAGTCHFISCLIM